MEIVQPAKTQKVSDRWKKQYCTKNQWSSVWLKTHSGSAKIIYDQIVAVEESRVRNKLDKIDAIIGNNGWTHHSCSQCGTETREKLLQLEVAGGEYCHNLCLPCVKEMLTLLENAK